LVDHCIAHPPKIAKVHRDRYFLLDRLSRGAIHGRPAPHLLDWSVDGSMLQDGVRAEMSSAVADDDVGLVKFDGKLLPSTAV
jgi:hypothetical protein